MPWIQLSVKVRGEDAERVESVLLAHGAQSLTLLAADGPDWFENWPGEPSPWRSVQLRALFDPTIDARAVAAALRDSLAPTGIDSITIDEVQDRDWARAWMEHSRPLRFGRRLWVCPTTQAPPDATAVNVRIDPGHAFGSGTHESTALCLEWLESTALAGLELLDYGCGSGVLAIAALLLGADRAWACDIDPLARDATLANAALNDVSSKLWVGAPDALPDPRADVLIANILAGTLLELAPRFARLQQPGGRLVLAGILADSASGVLERYSEWYSFGPARRRNEWVLLAGSRLAT